MTTKEKEVKPSGGIVFYPREYVLDDNPDYSYAKGVDELGNPCVIYLNPDEESRSNARDSSTAQTIPSFDDFADTRSRAVRSCYVSKDNGPANPNGILLAEQVIPFKEPYHEHDVPVYSAGWASILRDCDESPKVPMGFGYFEINTHNQAGEAVNEYLQRYKDIDDDMKAGLIENTIDADEEKMNLYNSIMSLRKKWFIAVIIKHKLIKQVESPSKNSLADAIRPYLSGFTKSGMYGGTIVRVRKDNLVITDLSFQCDMVYDYANSVISDVDSIIDECLKWNLGKILRAVESDPELIVEVIPTQRINCGKLGNEKYGKEIDASGAASKIMKAYLEKEAHNDPFVNFKRDKKFLYCKVAVRPAEIYKGPSKGNILVSSIHAFSAPIGNVLSISNTGSPEYKLDNKQESS